MPKSEISLPREQLHDLVWTKPLKTVAEEYGSTAALVIEACARLQVPRPPQGYWSLVRFGQPGPRPALPPLDEAPKPSADSAGAPALLKIETTGIPPETAEPTAPLHSIARQTRQAYRGGSNDHKYGTVHPKPDLPHVMISATPPAMERAVTLLSEFARLLEGKGFTFTRVEKSATLQLIYAPTKTEVRFSVQERVDRYQRELTAADKERSYIFDHWRYRPTGLLRVVLAEYHPEGGRKSWGDGKNQKLESKLADIAEGFVVCAQSKHVRDLEWAETHRRWDKEERLRREAEAREKAEQARDDALRTAAKDWTEAESLRKFRSACETQLRSRHAAGALAPAEADWLDWVDTRIEALDPLKQDYLQLACE